MQTFTVIAAMGATLFGPARIKISREQWSRRVPILGPVPDRLKPVDIDGGQALHFKYGETFQIDAPGMRLSKAVFGYEDVDEPAGNDTVSPDGKDTVGAAAGA